MIIYKCDICNKETTNLKTIVLFKKSLDYCRECEEQTEEIQERIKEIIKSRYLEFESKVKVDEENLLRRYKRV